MKYKLVDEYTITCCTQCMNDDCIDENIDVDCIEENIVYKSLKDGLFYVWFRGYDCSCMANVIEVDEQNKKLH